MANVVENLVELSEHGFIARAATCRRSEDAPSLVESLSSASQGSGKVPDRIPEELTCGYDGGGVLDVD